MELIRRRANCFIAPSDEMAESLVRLGTANSIALRSGRIVFNGEHDLTSSDRLGLFGIAVGSGYPVSSSRAGQAGAEAMRAIAQGLLMGSDYSFMEEFDGPFLVMAYRQRSNEVIVARDKFGLRQAYYRNDGRVLILSDDIANLKSHWGGIRTPGLVEWMHYGAALAPFSLFNKISCLPAGSVLTFSVDTGECRVDRYFSPEQCISAARHAHLENLGVQELKRRVSEELDEAVSRSTAGQRQVSILLSGGVDSSLLAAYAKRHVDVAAITVDIQGPGGESEFKYASEVARTLGLDFRSIPFGPEQFVQTFCTSIQALATPIIIENAVALHYAGLSGNLPKGQLVLDGEGADALMGGSTPLFKYSMVLFLLRQIPLVGVLPFRSLLKGVRTLLERIGIATVTTLDAGGLDVALGARRVDLGVWEANIEKSLTHIQPLEANEMARLMLREFYDYLIPVLLRIDRMCLAAETHAVLPFFFHHIFSLLENVPMNQKIRWDWRRVRPVTKFLTKELLADHIPRSLIYRPKVGFGIPAWMWIRMPEAWRMDSWVAKCFGLSRAGLENWLQKNQNKRDLLFLTSLEVWGRLFDRQLPFAEVEAEWLAGQPLPQAGSRASVWIPPATAFGATQPSPITVLSPIGSGGKKDILEPTPALRIASGPVDLPGGAASLPLAKG